MADTPKVSNTPKVPVLGWKVIKSKSGKDYYYCKTNNKTQWETPTETDGGICPAEVEPTKINLDPLLGWEVKTSKSKGKDYYYCASTNESIWENPTKECKPKPVEVAPALVPATKNTKTNTGGINVTVKTTDGTKSFTVIAKGGKYKKTRKNKYKQKKSRKNKNKQRKSRRT